MQVGTQTRATKRAPREMLSFEQIILAKFFMHSLSHKTKLGNLYGLDHSSTSRHLDKWLPKWERFGEFLSIFPLPNDFFEKKVPDKFIELGEGLLKCEADGKDALTDTIRKKRCNEETTKIIKGQH